jgi:spectinomycin phosphotransferase
MFVSGGVGDLDPDGSSFYAGYGEADIDPIVMAYYRFDWVVQEIADYGRRVFHDDVGDETKEEAIEMVEDAFRPGRIVERAFEAAQQLDARPRGRSTSRVEE